MKVRAIGDGMEVICDVFKLKAAHNVRWEDVTLDNLGNLGEVKGPPPGFHGVIWADRQIDGDLWVEVAHLPGMVTPILVLAGNRAPEDVAREWGRQLHEATA